MSLAPGACAECDGGHPADQAQAAQGHPVHTGERTTSSHATGIGGGGMVETYGGVVLGSAVPW